MKVCLKVRQAAVAWRSGIGYVYGAIRLARCRTAGLTIARSRPRQPASKCGGFSLPEVLFALLLMALSSSTLLHYHRALALGFSQQWYQREAWRVAEQGLAGHDVAGWTSTLQQQSGPSGCTLERADVKGPFQRNATLTRLRC